MAQTFAVDGRAFGSSPGKGQNSLSGVAYFHTHGIKSGADRIGTAELRKLIEKLGGDPSGEFHVELPNGKHISATVVDGEATAPAPRKARQATGPADGPKRLSATERTERRKAAQDEAARVKAWEEAGGKGRRPATPNLDAVNADYQQRQARREARAQTAKAKVARQAAAKKAS